jgi:hypothetical protein
MSYLTDGLLEETLSFAVGSRGIGAGAHMLDPDIRSAMPQRRDRKLERLSVMPRTRVSREARVVVDRQMRILQARPRVLL